MSENIQMYQYRPLDPTAGEIRLVYILPGEFHDPIRLIMRHTSFVTPEERVPERQSREELQSSLPEGWDVYETWEHRYLFLDKTKTKTTWKHPDPEYNDNRYEQLGEIDHFRDPEFEALSYTWGDDLNPETIYIYDDHFVPSVEEGQLQTLQVTRNLASALHHLRMQDRERIMWIDAICINQNDNEEKSKQITRMRDIYILSFRVVVWLGEEAQGSGKAMKILRNLGSHYESSTGCALLQPGSTESRDELVASLKMPVLEDMEWQALFDLYSRSWFSRIWIMQEIALANHRAVVQCGFHQISWSVFRRALFCFHDGHIYPSASDNIRVALQKRLEDIDYLVRLTPDQILIGQVLEKGKDRAATNPRDKIYAILGLFEPSIGFNVEPNYALSTAEVYKDAFLRAMDLTTTLDLLSYCRIDCQIPDAPSWVPNWNSCRQPTLIYSPAQGFTCLASTKYDDTGTLEVSGKRCGTVAKVGQPLPSDARTFCQMIRDWESLTSGSRCPSQAKDFDAATYMATLARGCFVERYPSYRGWPILQRCTEIYRDHRDEELLLQSLRPCQPVGKTLLVTEDGQIGICSAASQPSMWHPYQYQTEVSKLTYPGDIVCCLPGCYAPLLLRSTTSGTFEVVGDCYFYHLEDQQGILGNLSPDWTVQICPDADDFPLKKFHNNVTGEDTFYDPRLSELFPESEKLLVAANGAPTFRTIRPGELIKNFPRLTCDDLRAASVELVTFRLV
jgi:hypothetical protein